jgi:uncharacterized protein YecE (DUF72 family)
MDLTADFVYCRLHGAEQLYVSGYEEDAINLWAHRAHRWSLGEDPPDGQRVSSPSPLLAGGRDVFIYFDNDVKVRAPRDAAALAARVAQLARHGQPGDRQ